jgi:hypothetical protein
MKKKQKINIFYILKREVILLINLKLLFLNSYTLIKELLYIKTGSIY